MATTPSLPSPKVRVVNIYRQGLTQLARLVRIGGFALFANFATNFAGLAHSGKALSLAAIVGALEVSFRQLVPATDEASIAAKVLKEAVNFVDPKKPAPKA